MPRTPSLQIRIPLLLGLFWLLPASAQTTTPPDSIQLAEVVILERRPRTSYGGITPTEVASAQAIAEFSPVDYSGVLNTVPGLFLQSGAYNTNRISIRGIGARTPFGTDKLRMYYNGIPVTNGTGVSVIEAFDLDNLASIEVIKGPYGNRFGSPLGGVLLLESMPVTEPGRQFTSKTTLGSYSLFKNHSRYRYLDDRSQLALSFNSLQSLGYRENSQFDRTGLFAQGEHLTGERSRLGFLVNYIDYFAQIPSSLNQQDFLQNPEQAAANWLAVRGFEQNQYLLAGIYHKWYLGGYYLLKSALFYSYLDHYEVRPFNTLTDITQSYGARLELSRKSEDWEYSVGLESYNDLYRWNTFETLEDPSGVEGSLQGELLSRNREYRNVHFGFARLQWNLVAGWMVSGGLTANLSRYQFRNFSGENATDGTIRRDFNPVLLPKLEVLKQWDRGLAYVRVGQGFSNPGLEEALTPEGVLNPDIQQEKGLSYELGYQRSLKQWQFSLNVFQMDVRDLLVARRFNEDQFIGINAGETRHRGLEASLSGQLGKTGSSQWYPRVSYTFSDFRFRDFVDGEIDYSTNTLPGVPKHYLNGAIRWEHPNGYSLTWTHEYNDPIALNDANTDYTEAYHLDRIRFAYRRTLPNGWTFGIDLGANNLFDVTYARSFVVNAVGFGGSAPRYFYPGEPLNFWGSLTAGIRW